MSITTLILRSLLAAAFLTVGFGTAARAQALLHSYLDGKTPWPGPKITYSGPPIEMRFSNPWPPVSQLVKMSNEMIAFLEKVTDGKIKVKAYHGGTLVPRPDGFKAARSDVTDLSGCYSEDERTMVGMHVFELPGVLPSSPAIGTRIANEIQAKYFKDEFARFDVYMGGTAQTGAGNQLMSRKPITKMEDLKGVKVANPNRLGNDDISAWGGVAVNVGFGELNTSLSNATADAIYWVDEAMIPFKIGGILKNRTQVGIRQTIIDTCYNKKWFDALPNDLKANVRLWALMYPQAIAQIATTERTDLSQYDALGVVTHKLSPDERARWLKATQPTVDRWKKDAKGRGYDPDRILADIEALKKKYENASLDDVTRLTFGDQVRGILE